MTIEFEPPSLEQEMEKFDLAHAGEKNGTLIIHDENGVRIEHTIGWIEDVYLTALTHNARNKDHKILVTDKVIPLTSSTTDKKFN